MLTRIRERGTVCPLSAKPVKMLLSQALNCLTAPVEELGDRQYKPAVVVSNSQVGIKKKKSVQVNESKSIAGRAEKK